MKKRIFVLAFLFVFFGVILGCTGLNESIAQSDLYIQAMQDNTVVALKEDLDPRSIKVSFDHNTSSYWQQSSWWYAELSDGRKYKCSKLQQTPSVCIKMSSKSTAPAANGQMKKRRPPHK
ncbi:MAG TPA: hypothetical protein P5323_01660 [Candidatus Moranbacteria bacterium]|nr:hypothetical protein [Candidatus Moranbacteria bacterium]HRY27821.1 hypothetical protein [Candidatus Moranbacteria bacterium]HSA08100.1 hypothetical protein [Candidatus Moranbacteria bacterium]